MCSVRRNLFAKVKCGCGCGSVWEMGEEERARLCRVINTVGLGGSQEVLKLYFQRDNKTVTNTEWEIPRCKNEAAGIPVSAVTYCP